MPAPKMTLVIDENLCDGCGLCLPACHEGAIQIVNGKARLIEELCDGLGACLGECPRGAILPASPEAMPGLVPASTAATPGLAPASTAAMPGLAPASTAATPGLAPASTAAMPGLAPASTAAMPGLAGPAPARNPALAASVPAPSSSPASATVEPCGCPGGQVRQLRPLPAFGPGVAPASMQAPKTPGESALSHWPVQINLVHPRAPFLAGADLLVAADCVPVACPNFHRDFLAGRRVMIGCPKFDDLEGYIARFEAIFRAAAIQSVTVAAMEVPCCQALPAAVREAVRRSGRSIPVTAKVVALTGETL